mmetsp:Transcript_2023/g.2452  ORF Transcript_2023/g.2452 Transcript_2023/m.2452 type:complete len:1070 (-) Transcript_2023:182-3391(-)
MSPSSSSFQIQYLEFFCLRFQGRRMALVLVGLSFLFSFFTAFHFDLMPNTTLDYYLNSAPRHVRDIMKLQKYHRDRENENSIAASAEWEDTKDESTNFHECSMNPYNTISNSKAILAQQQQQQQQESSFWSSSSTKPSALYLLESIHGCWTDPDTKIAYCRVENLKLDINKISGPLGGESLDDVMGREEELEIPQYHIGAFTTFKPLNFVVTKKDHEEQQGQEGESMNRDYWFYLLDVFFAMDMMKSSSSNSNSQSCIETWKGTTLLITRYEYVDLYHTLKDWWNAFMILPPKPLLQEQKGGSDNDVLGDITNKKGREGTLEVDRVIFLDSHAKGHLDEGWKTLFVSSSSSSQEEKEKNHQSTYHVKQIPDGVCLETAYFVPPGYSSVLWPLGRIFDAHRCPSMANAFVEYVMERFQIQHIKKVEFNIVILDQPTYIIHPRSSVSSDNNSQRRTKILIDLETKILSETDATSVQVKDLHLLNFKAQLKVIRTAHILIGFSSAGDKLIHAMFLHDNTKVIDISDYYDDDGGGTGSDLQNMLAWRPSIDYKSNVPVNLEHIIAEVKDVLTPGWDADGNRYPNEEEGGEEEEEDFMMGEMNDELSENDFLDVSNEEMITNEVWNVTAEDKLKGDGMIPSSGASENENANTNYFDRSSDYTQCGLYRDVFADNLSPQNGCIVDETEGSNSPICRAKQLQLDLSKIDFHGVLGGEYLDTVMGRDEDVEFPTYNEGAFVSSMENVPDADQSNEEKWSQLYYMKYLFAAMKIETDANYNEYDCALVIKEPTYFITRYEYVDPMRTLSDWWNTYWSSSFPETPSNINEQQQRPRIIFLDSHADGYLDPVWTHVFGPVTYIAQLLSSKSNNDDNKLVCIKDARFVPSGYSSYLSSDEKALRPCPAMMEKFVQHFVRSYSLQNVSMEPGRITIVQSSHNFITHPRMQPTAKTEDAEKALLEYVKDQLEKQLPPTTTIKIVQMEHMSFVERLRILRQTHVMIGMDQEWLVPHLLFLSDGVHVFDIGTNTVSLPQTILNWKRTVTYRYNILTQDEIDNSSNITAIQIKNRLVPLVQFALKK